MGTRRASVLHARASQRVYNYERYVQMIRHFTVHNDLTMWEYVETTEGPVERAVVSLPFGMDKELAHTAMGACIEAVRSANVPIYDKRYSITTPDGMYECVSCGLVVPF